jgi:hypothetical protein
VGIWELVTRYVWYGTTRTGSQCKGGLGQTVFGVGMHFGSLQSSGEELGALSCSVVEVICICSQVAKQGV